MVEFAPKIDQEDHQLGINSKLSTPEQLFLRGGDATENFFVESSKANHTWLYLGTYRTPK